MNTDVPFRCTISIHEAVSLLVTVIKIANLNFTTVNDYCS